MSQVKTMRTFLCKIMLSHSITLTKRGKPLSRAEFAEILSHYKTFRDFEEFLHNKYKKV